MARRRVEIIAVLVCLCCFLLPCRALAASTADAAEPIDPERACSLSVSYRSDGAGIAGVPVKLYRVAAVSADCRYTLTAPFAASGLVLNAILSTGEWNVIRSTLASYILANSVAPAASAATDPSGTAAFSSLQPGLYLAVPGLTASAGQRLSFDPALISLPALGEDGRWVYQTAVTAKGDVAPPDIPVTPDSPDPPTPPTSDEPEEIHYKVLKLWRGDEGQTGRPVSIEVEIFRDGVSHEIVVLSEENQWSYSWSAKDDEASWMIAERNVPPSYYATMEKRDTTFVLTNTFQPPDTPLPDGDVPSSSVDVPKTGDTPHILLYTALMYGSGTVLLLLGITGKRKRK